MMKKKLLTVLICSFALAFCISGPVLGAEDPPQGEGYHEGETEEGNKENTDSPIPIRRMNPTRKLKITRKTQIQTIKPIPVTSRKDRTQIKSPIPTRNRNSPNRMKNRKEFQLIRKHKK